MGNPSYESWSKNPPTAFNGNPKGAENPIYVQKENAQYNFGESEIVSPQFATEKDLKRERSNFEYIKRKSRPTCPAIRYTIKNLFGAFPALLAHEVPVLEFAYSFGNGGGFFDCAVALLESYAGTGPMPARRFCVKPTLPKFSFAPVQQMMASTSSLDSLPPRFNCVNAEGMTR